MKVGEHAGRKLVMDKATKAPSDKHTMTTMILDMIATSKCADADLRTARTINALNNPGRLDSNTPELITLGIQTCLGNLNTAKRHIERLTEDRAHTRIV